MIAPKRIWRIIWLGMGLWLTLFLSVNANAHEVRPAFLKISESQTHQFDVTWKQPVLGGKRLKLKPSFPEDCVVTEGDISFGSGTLAERSEISCDLKTGRIAIEGLERTLTDVFVEINYLSGETRREVLKPASIGFDLESQSSARTSQYLWIGVEHIIFGWDHLLFVIGLVLLVSRKQIIGVATAFTLAHSITLALASFGLLRLSIRPIEILIAMSIVLLAVEIMRKKQGKTGLSIERPYLIGFLIGLIHGCGFASALSNIGLPKGTELLALLLFNLGVEIGQFVIIGVFIILLALLTRINFNYRQRTEIAATYIIGSVAMFWVIQRLSDYIV